MGNAEKLNDIIEKELILNQKSDKKLRDLLSTARELYGISCGILDKQQAASINKMFLSDQVVRLKNNIKRLEVELEAFQVLDNNIDMSILGGTAPEIKPIDGEATINEFGEIIRSAKGK